MINTIQPDELDACLKTPIIVSTIVGDDALEKVVLRGGQHPRMRFVDDALFEKSFSAALLFDTTDPVITLKKGAGRITVAVTAGGLSATSVVERFTRTAAAAGIDEDKVAIFERDDDVVIVGDEAGGANGKNLVQLYFERME